MATKKKTVKKKAAAKKTASKKAAAKKTVSRAKAAPAVVKEPYNKSTLYTAIAERTDLKRKDVDAVFSELGNIINAHIKRNAAGTFTFPGLFKVKVVRKPATKARKGVNPFTGEPTVFKAKPARNVVKILPLKNMKDMAK